MDPITWLVHHLVESEESDKVDGQQLFEDFLNQGFVCSQQYFGHCMKFCFPNVLSKRGFSKACSRTINVYFGVKQRHDPVREREFKFTFKDIKYIIPSDFYATSETDKSLTIFSLSVECLNDCRVTKEVTFDSNGTWYLSVGKSDIDLEKLGISNLFTLTPESIQTVCCIVRKLKLCTGKSKSYIDNAKLCGNAHIILENWRQTELLQPESKCRSSRCSRILKPLSTGTACDKCVKNLPFHASKKSQINVSTDMETHDRNKENNDPSLIKVQSPSENASLMTLIKEQEKNIKCRPTSRRWSKDTIMSCLSIWRRSKRAYDDLIHSSALVMPSDRLLRLYQNTCEQSPGFHLDIFQWMKDEACRRNIQGAGLEGGILFDEMSIQEDLVLQASGEYQTLIGFVNTGEEGDVMRTLCESKTTKTLATHVLQFVFLTFGGFRFPFAHFPTTQIKPFELQYLFWQAVKYLGMYGFTVCFTSQDGAQTNRDFINMFFREKTASECCFAIRNIYHPSKPELIFIMDYSHVIKRIRNNVSKSGIGKGHKRCLMLGGQNILWAHWISAFKWDTETNPFPIHHKLTHDHFYLTSESKMRNKLAEDVLDRDMLHLMLEYQSSLINGTPLQSTVEFLKKTSLLVTTFRDNRPITDKSDQRLQDNQTVLEYFQDWDYCITNDSSLSNGEKEKARLSYQTRDDIKSLITGFDRVCKTRLGRNMGSVVPSRVNSDAIENVFCQQRGICQGANTNPTYAQYSKAMNTVILGQSTISRKSNTGVERLSAAEPVCLTSDRPLRPLKKTDSRI